jgi:hypothetical protein
MTRQRGAHWGRRIGFSSFKLETNDCLKLLCHFLLLSGFGVPPFAVLPLYQAGLLNSVLTKPQPVTV